MQYIKKNTSVCIDYYLEGTLKILSYLAVIFIIIVSMLHYYNISCKIFYIQIYNIQKGTIYLHTSDHIQ